MRGTQKRRGWLERTEKVDSVLNLNATCEQRKQVIEEILSVYSLGIYDKG